MALTIDWTDSRTGARHTEAAAIPMRVYIEADRLFVRVVYHLYASAASAADGLAPVGTREVLLTGAAFGEFAAMAPDGENLFDAISNACYVAAERDSLLAAALPG